MSAPAPDLVDRYGAPPRRRPLVVASVVAVAVLGLAWLSWVVLFHTTPAVTSQLVAFDVEGEHSATARFTVVRSDTDVEASCLLRASADDHSVVGELTVPVVSGPTTATLSSTVRTERRATTVEMVGCTAAGQRKPR